MKKLISKIAIICILCFASNKLNAQDGYTYTLIDNGSFNYTIAAVPNTSSSNFATSVQSYGFTILLPDGITASISSSLGSSANATFFDGNAIGQPTIDGYLITETLGSPISLPAPSNGIASPMVTIQLDQSPTSGEIKILENDAAIATTITALKSFMSADMIDDSSAIFAPVIDPNAAAVSGTSSYTFSATLSIEDQESIGFSIAPNPTTDILFISKSNPSTKIEVMNMNGQLVISKKENLEHIKVNHLQSGMYFIKVYSEKGSSTKKFIKK